MNTSSTSDEVTRVPFRGGPSQVDSQGAVSQQGAPYGATINQTESSRLLPMLMLACILGGAAVVMGWMAYRMASIATMRVEGFTRALIAHGIKDTYPHLPGEDD